MVGVMDPPRPACRCPARAALRGGWFEMFWAQPLALVSVQFTFAIAGVVAAFAVGFAGSSGGATAILLALAAGTVGMARLRRHIGAHPPPATIRARGGGVGSLHWWAAYEVCGALDALEPLAHRELGGAKAHDSFSLGPRSYAFAGNFGVSYVATTDPGVFRLDLYSLEFPLTGPEAVRAAMDRVEEALFAVSAEWQTVAVDGDPDAVAAPRGIWP